MKIGKAHQNMMNQETPQQPPMYMPPPQQFHPPPLTFSAAENALAQKVATERRAGQKFRVAFLATIWFIVFSNIGTYRITNNIYASFAGKAHEILTDAGMPTIKGYFLHTFLFFVFVVIIVSNI